MCLKYELLNIRECRVKLFDSRHSLWWQSHRRQHVCHYFVWKYVHTIWAVTMWPELIINESVGDEMGSCPVTWQSWETLSDSVYRLLPEGFILQYLFIFFFFFKGSNIRQLQYRTLSSDKVSSIFLLLFMDLLRKNDGKCKVFGAKGIRWWGEWSEVRTLG